MELETEGLVGGMRCIGFKGHRDGVVGVFMVGFLCLSAPLRTVGLVVWGWECDSWVSMQDEMGTAMDEKGAIG